MRTKYMTIHRTICLALFLMALPVALPAVDEPIVGIAGPAINMIYSFVARDAGLFKKYGIDAELIYISSGPTVVQALLGGDVVGGVAATNAVIAAVLRGAPLVSVLSTCNRPYHRLWVQPEIKTFDDLKGKVLGITRFGSVTDNLTRMILKKQGLENAVQVRQMGGIIEVSSAFQNKQIAGAVTSSLRVDGVQPRQLAKLEDMGFQYSMDVIAHARDDLKKYPLVVEGMVRAYTEGVAAMHFQKERANRAIAKYARLRDQKKIDEIYQDSIIYLEKTPRIEPGSINSILDFMGKKGVPLETFADNSIVDKMVREGFIDRLYKKP